MARKRAKRRAEPKKLFFLLFTEGELYRLDLDRLEWVRLGKGVKALKEQALAFLRHPSGRGVMLVAYSDPKVIWVVRDAYHIVRELGGKISVFLFNTKRNFSLTVDEKKVFFFSLSSLGGSYFVLRRKKDVISGLKKFLELLREWGIPLREATSASRVVHRLFTRECRRVGECPSRYALPDIKVSEREALFGGRVEAYRLGEIKTPLVRLDVNSLYPFILNNYPMPRSLLFAVADPEEKRRYGLSNFGFDKPEALIDVVLDYLDNHHFVVLRGVVECYPEKILPAPKRIPEGDKLVFPYGRFTTYLSTPEIELLLKGDSPCRIIRVLRVMVYDVFRKNPFRFLRSLFLLKRKEKNPFLKDILKIMMNSLWGRISRKKMVYLPLQEPFKTTVKTMAEEAGVLPVDSFRAVIPEAGFDRVITRFFDEFYLVDEVEVPYSFVPLGVATTAYARVYMYRLLKVAEPHIVYTDTDSIILPEEEIWRYNPYIGLDWGMLKIEGYSERTVIFGEKAYVFGGEMKIAGIPLKTRKIKKTRWGWVVEFKPYKNEKMELAGIKPKKVKRILPYHSNRVILPNLETAPRPIWEQ